MLSVPWSLAGCVVAAAIATITDLRSRTIPNWLTLPLPPIGIVVHSVSLGFEGMWLSCLGCLVCCVPAYVLFARGALGGGDVKLFAGLGALLGAREGLEIQLAAFALASLYALWVAAWHGRLTALLRASCLASMHLIAPTRFERPVGAQYESVEMPMGMVIFVASLAVALRSLP